MQNQPNALSDYTIKLEEYQLNDDFPLHFFDYKPKPVIHNMHFHSFVEIGYCTEGTGIFVIDGHVIPFEAGKILIIYPNQLHKAQSVGEGSRWTFIYLHPEKLLNKIPLESFLTLSSILDPNNRYDNQKVCNKSIQTAVTAIISELESGSNNRFDCVRAMLWYLFLKLKDELQGGDAVNKENKSIQRLHRLAPALDYISKNFVQNIAVSEVAKQCYMSLTTLRREFAESLQTSPLEYITVMRIKTAALLIRESQNSISDISGEVGFSTLSSFNRHFKRIMGCSPRQYRFKE